MRVPRLELAPPAGDWARWLLAACLLGGAVSLIVVFDYGRYPFDLNR